MENLQCWLWCILIQSLLALTEKKFILMLMVWHRTHIIIHLKPDMDKTSAKCSSETLRINIFYLPFLILKYQDQDFLFKARTCLFFVPLLCLSFLYVVWEGVSGLLLQRRWHSFYSSLFLSIPIYSYLFHIWTQFEITVWWSIFNIGTCQKCGGITIVFITVIYDPWILCHLK